MFLKERVDEYAVIARVNVPWLDGAVKWYEDKLGMEEDESFHVPNHWAQLNCPGIKRFAVGLCVGPSTPTPGNVVTFLVKNINEAREDLTKRGVVVGPIQDAGKGVKLAFFCDPFGNSLAIRENSSKFPNPEDIGAY